MEGLQTSKSTQFLFIWPITSYHSPITNGDFVLFACVVFGLASKTPWKTHLRSISRMSDFLCSNWWTKEMEMPQEMQGLEMVQVKVSILNSLPLNTAACHDLFYSSPVFRICYFPHGLPTRGTVSATQLNLVETDVISKRTGMTKQHRCALDFTALVIISANMELPYLLQHRRVKKLTTNGEETAIGCTLSFWRIQNKW